MIKTHEDLRKVLIGHYRYSPNQIRLWTKLNYALIVAKIRLNPRAVAAWAHESIKLDAQWAICGEVEYDRPA